MIVALLVGVLLGLAVLLLAVPVLVFTLEIAAACLPARRGVGAAPRPAVALLVPAHNEALGIAATLRNLRAQMRPGDRCVVVADNCSDDTAERARAEGVEVVERRHATQRGKGYALAFGVEHLRQAPPPVVVIVDADCQLDAGALDALAAASARSGAPIQARYLMTHEGAVGLNGRVAEFAWRVKNWVRPRGAARLGWPCQLTGSGMAFPWALIESAPLANGSIVEDMQLGLVLARAGDAPQFCEAAGVRSTFPTGAAAIASQRTRWEHGHLGMLADHALPMLQQGVQRADWRLLGLALDLAVPPLALLVMLVTALWALALVMGWFGAGSGPLWGASGLLAILASGVMAAWAGWGRAVLAPWDLIRAPWYAVSKLAIYLRFWSRRQKDWVRTDRE
ncbi:MAG TPA: glycosyltransferase [Ideonella sp.]|uniref:glycosyltransferase family 2 protein n=1 Tax=Ideonella sp. TaxID=1929293 RepID=UPI002E2FB9D4|nr:glycosyltransferase [Ideonella sp.]HEX5687202.1 glycosyltransferase [Ideonella sp.]